MIAHSPVLTSAPLPEVEAALLVLGRLPPPAAGADVLSRRDRARAGRAADRRIAARVQRVHRQVVLARVTPDLRFGPGGERVQLDDPAVRRIDLDHLDGGAGRRLLAPQTRQPGQFPRQRALQRLQLADRAALLALLDAAAEGEEALLALELLDGARLRKKRCDLRAVPPPHLLDH